jgi:hypothetical protein
MAERHFGVRKIEALIRNGQTRFDATLVGCPAPPPSSVQRPHYQVGGILI